MPLTGNVRHRLSSFGKKLILQVEVEYLYDYCIGGYIEVEKHTKWRDAKVEDFSRINIWGSLK